MIKLITDTIIDLQTEVKIAHQIPGRIRFRINALKYIPDNSLHFLDYLNDILEVLPAIENVSINNRTGSMLIIFNPDSINNDRLIKFVSQMVRLFVKSREQLMQIETKDIPQIMEDIKQYIKEKSIENPEIKIEDEFLKEYGNLINNNLKISKEALNGRTR